jgi:hypothetical protein
MDHVRNADCVGKMVSGAATREMWSRCPWRAAMRKRIEVGGPTQGFVRRVSAVAGCTAVRSRSTRPRQGRRLHADILGSQERKGWSSIETHPFESGVPNLTERIPRVRKSGTPSAREGTRSAPRRGRRRSRRAWDGRCRRRTGWSRARGRGCGARATGAEIRSGDLGTWHESP